MTFRPTLALCVLALIFAACDSGEESTLASASFSLRVDGGVERTYTQSAYFGETEQEGMTVFGVLLGEQEESQSVGLIRFGATPGSGSYQVADAIGSGGAQLSGFQGFYIDPSQFAEEPNFEDFDLSGFFYSRSGSVTLDRVERGESIEGEFSMSVQGVRVEGFDPEDPQGGNVSIIPTGDPFEVTGAFNAAFDADLFGDVEFPETDSARRWLALPSGVVRLPGLVRP